MPVFVVRTLHVWMPPAPTRPDVGGMKVSFVIFNPFVTETFHEYPVVGFSWSMTMNDVPRVMVSVIPLSDSLYTAGSGVSIGEGVGDGVAMGVAVAVGVAGGVGCVHPAKRMAIKQIMIAIIKDNLGMWFTSLKGMRIEEKYFVKTHVTVQIVGMNEAEKGGKDGIS
jgi:hypothetical protein